MPPLFKHCGRSERVAWEILVLLGAVALVLLFAYLIYTAAFRAFEAVGFSRAQASALLLGAFLLSWIDVPIWYTANGWLLAVNVGGAVVPIVVSLWLLSRHPSAVLESLVAIILVTIVTYFIVTPTPQGIVAPIYLAILAPLTAATVSILAHWRYESYAAPIAFIGGAIGSLVGADVLHIQEFLAQPPPAEGPAIASIGGAGVWDMVFLSAILAVALDMMFFHRVRKERGAPSGWAEAEVFTTATPPELIRDWQPPAALRDHQDDRAQRVRQAVEERRRALQAKAGSGPGDR